MPKVLDLSGLACPLPVIRTKEALEAEAAESLVVVVDNEAARDNVTRFAESRGCRVDVAAVGSCYHLTVEPPAGEAAAVCVPLAAPAPAPRTTVVVFASEHMGEGDPVLGAVLMRAFLSPWYRWNCPRNCCFTTGACS